MHPTSNATPLPAAAALVAQHVLLQPTRAAWKSGDALYTGNLANQTAELQVPTVLQHIAIGTADASCLIHDVV
jgi:hypothetical protein